jgi:DnaJ-class molecular chaperone
MEHATSYYDTLNVSPKSSDEDVKRAYHMLAKKFHPDRNPHNRFQAEQRFRNINEAYAQLKTREKRIAYNRNLRQKRQSLIAENDNSHNSFFAQISNMFWPKNAANKQEF